jgi:hypothetical protein
VNFAKLAATPQAEGLGPKVSSGPAGREEPSPRMNCRKNCVFNTTALEPHLARDTNTDTLSGMCALLIRGYGQNVPPCTSLRSLTVLPRWFRSGLRQHPRQD